MVLIELHDRNRRKVVPVGHPVGSAEGRTYLVKKKIEAVLTSGKASGRPGDEDEGESFASCPYGSRLQAPSAHSSPASSSSASSTVFSKPSPHCELVEMISFQSRRRRSSWTCAGWRSEGRSPAGCSPPTSRRDSWLLTGRAGLIQPKPSLWARHFRPETYSCPALVFHRGDPFISFAPFLVTGGLIT